MIRQPRRVATGDCSRVIGEVSGDMLDHGGLGLIWLRAAGWLKGLRASPRIAPLPGPTESTEPAAAPSPVPDRRIFAPSVHKFRVGPASRFRRRPAEAGDARLDVTRIGLPTLGPSSVLDEFHPILDFLHARGAFGESRAIAVLGRNEMQERTTFALNLALAASLSGEATALFEADRNSNRLAQAIAASCGDDEAAPAEPILRTANRMLLAHLPLQRGETEWTRTRIVQALRNGDRPTDWLFCDGPGETAQPEVSDFFDEMDDVLVVVTQHDHAMEEVASLRRELGRNGQKIAACVVVDTAIFYQKAAAEAV